MKIAKRYLFVGLLVLLSSATAAADNASDDDIAKKIDHWAGSQVQLGFSSNTGNSETTSFNGGLDAIYTDDPYQNKFNFDAQFNRSNGETSKERYHARDQFNYNVSEKDFLFSKIEFTRDRFSPYKYQGIGAVGYGRLLYDSDAINLTAQAGPGIRFNQLETETQMKENVIASTEIDFDWHITDTFTFSQVLSGDFGSPFQHLTSTTKVTNKIIHNLALQVSFLAEYYSSIPRGSSNDKNTDTTTTVALVYSF